VMYVGPTIEAHYYCEWYFILVWFIFSVLILALDNEHTLLFPPFWHWDLVAFSVMDVAIAAAVGLRYSCCLLTKQCVWGSGVIQGGFLV